MLLIDGFELLSKNPTEFACTKFEAYKFSVFALLLIITFVFDINSPAYTFWVTERFWVLATEFACNTLVNTLLLPCNVGAITKELAETVLAITVLFAWTKGVITLVLA